MTHHIAYRLNLFRTPASSSSPSAMRMDDDDDDDDDDDGASRRRRRLVVVVDTIEDGARNAPQFPTSATITMAAATAAAKCIVRCFICIACLSESDGV